MPVTAGKDVLAMPVDCKHGCPSHRWCFRIETLARALLRWDRLSLARIASASRSMVIPQPRPMTCYRVSGTMGFWSHWSSRAERMRDLAGDFRAPSPGMCTGSGTDERSLRGSHLFQ